MVQDLWIGALTLGLGVVISGICFGVMALAYQFLAWARRYRYRKQYEREWIQSSVVYQPGSRHAALEQLRRRQERLEDLVDRRTRGDGEERQTWN